MSRKPIKRFPSFIRPKYPLVKVVVKKKVFYRIIIFYSLPIWILCLPFASPCAQNLEYRMYHEDGDFVCLIDSNSPRMVVISLCMK